MTYVLRLLLALYVTESARSLVPAPKSCMNPKNKPGGRLESIDGVEIVVFLESNFGIDFTKIGFDQTLIDSIDSIMALTEKAVEVPK